MVQLTQSLSHWLFEHHREKMVLILFGHTELLTDEMWDEYIKWCQTDEGKQYLKGGSKYKPDPEIEEALEPLEEEYDETTD